MNYDLCDLLNQKMENLFSYNKNNEKSIFNGNLFLNVIENNWPDNYLGLLENEMFSDKNIFAHWVYRNGNISDQIKDFDQASKKILREISNMTYSNQPSIDIMYFSGVLKLIYHNENFMYIETASKPSLDQLMSIRDFQNTIKCPENNIFWKTCHKKNKNSYDMGIGLNSLFAYNFSRIK